MAVGISLVGQFNSKIYARCLLYSPLPSCEFLGFLSLILVEGFFCFSGVMSRYLLSHLLSEMSCFQMEEPPYALCEGVEQ